MFKKKPQIKPAAPLRSSDRRKLADSIIHEYNLLEPLPQDQSDEQKAESTSARTNLRNSILPDNVQTARFSTTHGPELKKVTGTVYIGAQNAGHDSRILWWQIEGRMYPSVYTLWKHPAMLPLLHTPTIVVEKMKGGADLMTPGLANGPPFDHRATKGAIVAVASLEKPSVPVAVGVCEIDVAALQRVQGAKGVAIENLHWAGDELWNYSPAGRAGATPPDEIQGWIPVEDSQLQQKTANLTLEDDADGGGVALGAGETPNDSNATQKQEQANGTEAHRAPELKPLSQKEIDQAFRNAFLYAVHHYKSSNPYRLNTPKQPVYGLIFPLSQSFVLDTLIKPFLPTFTPESSQQLQIKNTSWKSIKKFINSLDKEQLVKAKERAGHEIAIWDIDWEDSTVVNFKPYPLPKKETPGDKAIEQTDTGDDSIGQKLAVQSLYKPTAKLSPIFATGDKNMFTAAEVKEVVTAYIESESLVLETNKRLVKLDPTLANAVFDGSGSLDKEVLAKGTVPRDALSDRILHALAPCYTILRNDADPSTVKPRAGAPPKILITMEKRSGNKKVTRISGLEVFYIQPRPLADELRKVCAGSTSVEPLAGATKKNEKPIEEIMVQGPQDELVIDALRRRGVRSRWVNVVDKTKPK